MIERSEISEVMSGTFLGGSPVERNEQRRAAVVEFLKDKPDHVGLAGSEHSMILSDLKSYPEWEREDGRQPTSRDDRRKTPQYPSTFRSRPN